MKIIGSQLGTVASVYLDKVKKTAPSPVSTAAQQTDKVELSKDVAAIDAARKAIADTPDIREDKVNALRQEISEGKYKVPAEQVADKILTEARLSILGRT